MTIKFGWPSTRRLSPGGRDRRAIRELRSLCRVKGWSGSNFQPHYMIAGRAHPLDSRPPHNRDDEAGSQAVRKPWRGVSP